jgi:Concanavalin A-like lectin/glucanases superfamily/Secretion system C-terminal sorting domain/PQQ-like domain/PKD domain
LVTIASTSTIKLSAQVPFDNLVAYYPFNGNANDGSGNGYNGIVHGASLAPDRFGHENSAYSFDGVNSYIDLGDILDNVFCTDTAQFTISGWAMTRMYNPNEGNLIIGKTAGGSGPYQWSISHNDGMVFGGIFSDSTAQNYQQKYTLLGTNQWFHFVLIFDGKQPANNRIQIYVNDTLDMYDGSNAGTLGTSTENTSLHLYIGGQNYFSTLQSLYNGLVDDIRIYSRPLTQTEVNALYHEGGWGTNHSPVANAGVDQTIYTDSTSGISVKLDASRSSDIDGDMLTYTWKESDTFLAAGINPSVLLSFGIHNITLFVSDGRGGFDSDKVIVTINHSTNSLAAYYPFNGNANDASGNGHNAAFIYATPTFDRFGKDSSAYSFNGIDNYIDFGDILDDVFCKDTAQFSISGWAKTKIMGNVYGEGNLIIGKTAGGSGPYQWSISHNSGMLFGGIFSDSTVNNYQAKYISIGTNQWFHFVLIFDGKQSVDNRIRVFVNNISDMHYWSGSGTLGTTTRNTSLHLYVGGQNYYSQIPTQSLYNGDVDDIRIYSKVLTNEEISALYHEGGWDTTNHAPIANAGPDIILYADSLSSALVTLDGSASSDKDGDTLTYIWKQANTTLATGVRPIVRLPLGRHAVTLIVADGKGGIDTDQVVITIYNQLKVVFTLNVGGPIYAGISVIGDNAMYAIASGDAVYRMNTVGSVFYALQVAGDIRSSSSIAYDTTVYIASSDRNLYAFSRDGNSIWTLPTGGVLTATPVVDSIANRLYIGVSNHNFIAVNRLTGKVDWNYFADAQINNSAVVTGDRKLVFATQKGTLYGFDLKTLTLPVTPTWQIALPDTAPSSIALDNQGYIYVGTSSGNLLKISMLANQQPSVVWQVPLGQAIVGSPVIDAAGTLYVGSLNANLYAIDIRSGAVKWVFSTQGAIRSTPAISGAGNIYVANDSGEVISLDTSKNILWYYKTNSAIAAPLLYYKSTLYIGTLGNQVIALYDVADSSQATSPHKANASRQISGKPIWATYQGNNQRTGTFSSSGTTGIKNPSGRIPIAYTLMQNYPNPFNPSTTIQFALPKDGKVSIKIFNMLGQHIATLIDNFQSAGYHEVTFNIDSFSSGIYFYQMTAGSFVATKKMLLMK